MDKEVRIKKTVFSKDKFDKVVDRSFKSYVQPDEVITGPTVEQFFLDYESLYLTIPPTGETNSHEYLIRRSSELVDYEKDTADIQPLLDEIAQLRDQNLEAQQQIIDLTIQLAGG